MVYQNEVSCSNHQSLIFAQNRSRKRSVLSCLGQSSSLPNVRAFSSRELPSTVRQHYEDYYRTIPIGKHGLTVRWLIENTNLVLDEESIKKVETAKLSSDGFVSQIIRVNFNCKAKTAVEVVVKMPETGNIRVALEKTTGQKLAEGEDEKFIWGLNMFFNREITFYKMERIPNLLVPQVHYQQNWIIGKQNGAIVMQDLKTMCSVPYYQSLNMKQLQSVGAQLHALHLFSLQMDDTWRNNFPYPMELIDTVSGMTGIVQLFVTRNPALAPLYERLVHLYNDREMFIRVLRDSHKEIGIDDVLCHGDLWFYNLMWKPTSSDEECPSDTIGAVIDWQNVHTGSIGEDFGHLLAFCCDAEVRRQAEREYLPVYFEQLRSLAAESKRPFRLTLNQFVRAYNRSFIAHALHLPFIACVMLCVKPAPTDGQQIQWTKVLVKRTLACWEDALERIREEFPEYEI